MPAPFQEGSKFTVIKADNYPAVCVGYLELGTHPRTYKGEVKPPTFWVRLQFEIPSVRQDDGSTILLSKKIKNISYGENAIWRQTLDGWLGKGWEATHGGSDFRFLLGMPALIDVSIYKGDDNQERNGIETVTKFPSMFGQVKGERPTLYYTMDERRIPSDFSTWIADDIRSSFEYQAGGWIDEAPTKQDRSAYTPRTPAPALPTRTGSPVDVNDPGDGCPY